MILFKNIFVILFAVSLLINSISLFYYSEFVGRRCTCTSQNPPDPSAVTLPGNPSIIPRPKPPHELSSDSSYEPIPDPTPPPPEPPRPTQTPSLAPITTPILPRPQPFSLYVLDLPPEFTDAYHGWVDPLHTAFLNNAYRTLDIDHADFVIVPYYQTQTWNCILYLAFISSSIRNIMRSIIYLFIYFFWKILVYNSTRIGKDTFSKGFEEKLLRWLKKYPSYAFLLSTLFNWRINTPALAEVRRDRLCILVWRNQSVSWWSLHEYLAFLFCILYYIFFLMHHSYQYCAIHAIWTHQYVVRASGPPKVFTFLSNVWRINHSYSYSEIILFQRQIVIPYRETNPLFISEPYWSSKSMKKYLIQFCGSISRCGTYVNYYINFVIF